MAEDMTEGERKKALEQLEKEQAQARRKLEQQQPEDQNVLAVDEKSLMMDEF